MIKTSITISNKLGLHARASAKLTKLAGSFQSEVSMSRNDRRVNAKSIMGVMMLAAGIGSIVEIEIDGPDEQAAMDAIIALIKGYLRCGAKVLGAPAWDPDFNTADLPMLLRIDDLPPRYRKHFLGA